jgi:hypothetical protein
LGAQRGRIVFAWLRRRLDRFTTRWRLLLQTADILWDHHDPDDQRIFGCLVVSSRYALVSGCLYALLHIHRAAATRNLFDNDELPTQPLHMLGFPLAACGYLAESFAVSDLMRDLTRLDNAEAIERLHGEEYAFLRQSYTTSRLALPVSIKAGTFVAYLEELAHFLRGMPHRRRRIAFAICWWATIHMADLGDRTNAWVGAYQEGLELMRRRRGGRRTQSVTYAADSRVVVGYRFDRRRLIIETEVGGLTRSIKLPLRSFGYDYRFRIARGHPGINLTIGDMVEVVHMRRPEWKENATLLGHALIEPILSVPECRKALSAGATLTILPSGSLWYVPFCALRVEGKSLVEQWPISYGYRPADERPAGPASARFRSVVCARQLASPEVWKWLGDYGPCDESLTLDSVQVALSAGNTIHIVSHYDKHNHDPRGDRILQSDGSYLGIKELLSARLDHIDLLFMAGCTTGRQADWIGRERGVDVLPNSYWHDAGVRDVVATMWRAPERATAALSRRFYRYRTEGHDGPNALRLAQLDLLEGNVISVGASDALLFGGPAPVEPKGKSKPYGEPYYWANFFMTQLY